MINKLLVQNFAVIESTEIGFSEGLNLFTGETGAGKTLIADSIEFVLGGRASKTMIRRGTDECSVQLAGENASHEPFSITRKIGKNGKSVAKINGKSVAISELRKFGKTLVDIHGQHDHQRLLKTENHLGYLDDFAGTWEIRHNFSSIFDRLADNRNALRKLIQQISESKEKRRLCEFELEEIEMLNLQEGESEQITEELKRAENAETLMKICHNLTDQISENERNLRDMLVGVSSELKDLKKIDSGFSQFVDESEIFLRGLDELTNFLRNYAKTVEIEPQRVAQLHERLDELNRLAFKYGGTVDGIFTHKMKIENYLAQSQNFDAQRLELENQIQMDEENLQKFATKLSAKRKKSAKQFAKEINENLKKIGMPFAEMTVDFAEIGSQIFRTGIDDIEFRIITNPGESWGSFAEILSGGELSRVMLCIKYVMAEKDSVPTMIFDEVDAGISGKIAALVGKQIQKLAAHHQVFTITHLPQIAALDASHFAIRKKMVNGRYATIIENLSTTQRTEEIAGLISGELVTDETLKTAEELLKLEARI